jgi:hypothetical protein
MNDRHRSDDQLGARLGAALRARHDGGVSPAPAVPFAALQRRADRQRHRRRVAVVATTGAVAVAVAGAAGARILGDDGPPTEYATSTPQQQAADLTGRYLPAEVPADLRLSYAMFQGPATVRTFADEWVQVFAPPTADLAYPGLLVRRSPAHPDVQLTTQGEPVTVGTARGVLVTQPSGVLNLWLAGSDAFLSFTTADLDREQLLAVAATAAVVPDGPGVTLSGLPSGWAEVAAGPATSVPEVDLQWFGGVDSDRQLGLQIVAPAIGYPAFNGIGGAAEPRTLADGTPALFIRASDGLAVWWRSAEGGAIALQSSGLSEAELLAVADSVGPVERGEWEARLADADVDDYLTGPNGEVAGDTVTATTTGASPVDVGSPWRPSGATLEDLPVGSWRTVEPGAYPFVIARTGPDTVVGLYLLDSNQAGTCYFVPADRTAPIRPGRGPTSGTVDATDPRAVAFTNDCTGATYTLAGDVVAGAAVGLQSFDVRVAADGAIEVATDNVRHGRPAGS